MFEVATGRACIKRADTRPDRRRRPSEALKKPFVWNGVGWTVSSLRVFFARIGLLAASFAACMTAAAAAANPAASPPFETIVAQFEDVAFGLETCQDAYLHNATRALGRLF